MKKHTNTTIEIPLPTSQFTRATKKNPNEINGKEISLREIEIENVREEFALAHQGRKETLNELKDSPNDQELLENLDYYQEEIIYYAGVLDGLTIKGDS